MMNFTGFFLSIVVGLIIIIDATRAVAVTLHVKNGQLQWMNDVK